MRNGPCIGPGRIDKLRRPDDDAVGLCWGYDGVEARGGGDDEAGVRGVEDEVAPGQEDLSGGGDD